MEKEIQSQHRSHQTYKSEPISTMDFINALNKMGAAKSYVKLNALEAGRRYKIVGGRKMDTKFGEAQTAELEEGYIFLPKRFNAIDRDVFDSLIKQGLFLVRSADDVLYFEAERSEDKDRVAALNKLGAVKPFIKLNVLEPARRYKIVGERKINTKFGESQAVEIEEGIIFLPKRFSNIDRDVFAVTIEQGLFLVRSVDNALSFEA